MTQILSLQELDTEQGPFTSEAYAALSTLSWSNCTNTN